MTLIQLEEELKEARLRGAQDHAAVILRTYNDGHDYAHVKVVKSQSLNSGLYVGPAVVLS